MTTVYVLTWAVDYEGASLLGVYPTREAAEAAGQAWLDELERALDSFEQLVVHDVEVGAAAEIRW